MNQKTYAESIKSIDVDAVLKELLLNTSINYRLLEIRQNTVCWEIDNQLGHNVYVVRVDFSSNTKKTYDNITSPSIEKLRADIILMKKLSGKTIEITIPAGTCLCFASLEDAMTYSRKAGGLLYKSYKESNLLLTTKS